MCFSFHASIGTSIRGIYQYTNRWLDVIWTFEEVFHNQRIGWVKVISPFMWVRYKSQGHVNVFFLTCTKMEKKLIVYEIKVFVLPLITCQHEYR